MVRGCNESTDITLGGYGPPGGGPVPACIPYMSYMYMYPPKTSNPVWFICNLAFVLHVHV